MGIDFSRGVKLFKALSDETRVKIVHILSCGELCACDILEYFDLSQPTLSHHLAILMKAGIVTSRAEGKWVHYSLATGVQSFLTEYMQAIFHSGEKCLCKKNRANTRNCDER
jgi:ArsR family transcriptional regulator, arsenate/arsenite/antimonite-responsive transcriptional repressor